MKMGVGTRVVFSVFLLLVIGVCGIIIFAALGGFPAENMMELFRGFTETNFRFIWLGAAAVMLVVAVCLLFFGIRHRETAPETILLHALADGSVSISVGAMQELTGRYLNTVKGIDRPDKRGWAGSACQRPGRRQWECRAYSQK